MSQEDPSPLAVRHRELWEARDSRLAKLLFFTLLLGAIGTWKVARPAVDHARAHATATSELAVRQRDEQELARRTTGLLAIEKGLESAGDAIRRKPWDASFESLKQGFARLRAAEKRFRADPAAVRAFVAASPHDGRGEQRPLTAQHPLAEENAPLLTESALAEAELGELLAPLRLDAAAVAAADDANLGQLVHQALERASTDLVRATVDAIVAQVKEQIEAPVVAAYDASGLSAGFGQPLRDAIAALGPSLETWRRDHPETGRWYFTVGGKEEAFDELWLDVVKWSTRTHQEVGAVRQRMEHEIATSEALRLELDQRQEELEARKEELESSTKELLPSWISSFVSAAQLTRLLPFVLAALALLIALDARHVRRHHLACRDECFPGSPRAAAISSCWTLADRGREGTLWTTLCWIAVAAAWWLSLRGALDAADASWSTECRATLGEPPFAHGWLVAPRALLGIAPLLLAWGLAAAWRDRERRPGPTITEA